jgi:hypothetical protein
MKTITLIASIFLFAVLAYAAPDPEWQELKGEHFLIYFVGSSEFARDVLDKSEKYYRNIATNLGYPRYKEFWLWDKRVKIYIHPDRQSFLSASSQPYWSAGAADYTNKSILTHAGNESFLVSVLPHEIAHLIFRDFIGFKGDVPLWLDEGVAQWAEEAKKDQMKMLAKELYKDNKLLSMDDMMKLNMRVLKDQNTLFIRPTRTRNGEIVTLLLSTEHLVNTYYIEAVSLINFLVEKYGSETFAGFCRELRDGKTTVEALKSAYPDYIRTIKELEDRWRSYLEEQL